MVHEDDFCGNRLRLTAFLRIVGAARAHHRPSRSRRRVSVQRQRRVADGALSDAAMKQEIKENRTSIDATPDIDDSVQAGAAGTDRANPSWKQSSESDAEQRTLEEEATNEKASKATSTIQCRELHIRKKHCLSVNGLALVRTTTEIGLPSPSVRSFIFCRVHGQLVMADCNCRNPIIIPLPPSQMQIQLKTPSFVSQCKNPRHRAEMVFVRMTNIHMHSNIAFRPGPNAPSPENEVLLKAAG